MTDNFDITEAPPSTDDPFISPDDVNPRCVVCGVEIVYGGRGPKPKYCVDHKKNKATKRRMPASMAGLEQSLADAYRMMAMGVSMFNLKDGMEIEAHADQLAHSWVVAAETNPRLLKFLQRMNTGSSIGGVIVAHAAVAIPIAINHGVLERLGRKVSGV